MGDAANKAWWGPRIWRVLHLLAELTVERTVMSDLGPGWRAVLRTTTLMLPCDVCREHFGTTVRGWRIPSGVRQGLWAAHAATGGSLTEAELATVYGIGIDGSRLDEVTALVREIGREFRRANVLDRFRVGYLSEWERAVSGLVEVLRAPPPSMVDPSASRPGARSARIPAASPASLRGRPTLRGRRLA